MKILSLDFDYTLRHSDGSLSPILLEAMATAKKYNIHVFIISNRTILESLQFVQQIIAEESGKLNTKNVSVIKDNIVNRINQLSFTQACEKIGKLGLPMPKVSTLHDQLSKSEGSHYINIDQALDLIVQIVNKLLGKAVPGEVPEAKIRELSALITRMTDYFSNKDDTLQVNEEKESKLGNDSFVSLAVKDEKDKENREPTDGNYVMEEKSLRLLVLKEKSLNEQKPNPNKSAQMRRIAGDLKAEKIDFIHVDDSQTVITKNFGKKSMLDFEQTPIKIHDKTDLEINVYAVPYAEKSITTVNKASRGGRSTIQTSADQIHPKVLDAIVTQICPSKAQTIPVLSIDLDNTLFNTDKYKARLTPEILTLMYFAQATAIPVYINTNRKIDTSYNLMRVDMVGNEDQATHAKNNSLGEPLRRLAEHKLKVGVITPMDTMVESKVPYATIIQEAEEQILTSIDQIGMSQETAQQLAIEKQKMDVKPALIGEHWKRPQFSKLVEGLEAVHGDKNFEFLHIDDSSRIKSAMGAGKKIDNHKVTNYFFNVEDIKQEDKIGQTYQNVMVDVADKIGLKDYAEKIAKNVTNPGNPFRGDPMKDLAAFRYLLQTETDETRLLALQLFFEFRHGNSLNTTQRHELNYLLGNNPRISNKKWKNPNFFNATCYYQIAAVITKLRKYIKQRNLEGHLWVGRGLSIFSSKCGYHKVNAAEKILQLLLSIFFDSGNYKMKKEELYACIAKEGRLRGIIEDIPFQSIMEMLPLSKENRDIATRLEVIQDALRNSSIVESLPDEPRCFSCF